MSFATGGAFPPSLIPAGKKQALSTNYLSFNGGAGAGDTDSFAQQYLPELYEAEIERYGNRTLQGFLRMVGAEMPMSSDQVIWSEQNRLHIAYDDCAVVAGANSTITVTITPGAGNPATSALLNGCCVTKSQNKPAPKICGVPFNPFLLKSVNILLID